MSTTSPTSPQRGNLRFHKAFFEVFDASATQSGLLALGAQELLADGDMSWYLWQHRERAISASFLIRIRGPRLVLEGPDASSIGVGWRRLDGHLRPAAAARVAAGDDLGRFVPRPRPRTADRPDTFSDEHEARVLAEFHAAVYARWADTPQQRLGGLTPRQAAADPQAQTLLAALLDRMRAVEAERVSRGIPAVSVAELEQSIFN